MKVFWTRMAEKDLEDIIDYIHSDSSSMAIKIYERIKTAVFNLEQFPKHGRIVPELKEFSIHKYREVIVKPWRIIYHPGKQSVFIISIIDGRRDLNDHLLELLLR